MALSVLTDHLDDLFKGHIRLAPPGALQNIAHQVKFRYVSKFGLEKLLKRLAGCLRLALKGPMNFFRNVLDLNRRH